MKKCQLCDWKTIPGLLIPTCRYHWAKGVWGKKWAIKCHPNHPEARKKKK